MTDKTYTITFTAQELATIQTALISEVEHAHDAMRDAEGDNEEVSQYRQISHRNAVVWNRLTDLTK